MPFSAPAPTVHLAGVIVAHCARSPFNMGARVLAQSPLGDTVYAANHPGDMSQTKFARIRPGALTAASPLTVPAALNDMHNVADAALTNANRMRVIALLNPRKSGGTVLLRVGNDATPATGEFQQTDANTLTFGDALAATDDLELYVLDAADITASVLAAGQEYSMAASTFMIGDGTNATDLSPDSRG